MELLPAALRFGVTFRATAPGVVQRARWTLSGQKARLMRLLYEREGEAPAEPSSANPARQEPHPPRKRFMRSRR